MNQRIFESKKNFGNSFEDFQVNDVFKHWPGKSITESDNNLFSLLTMNHHPIHLDKNYAETQKHQKILVVGTLVFSLVVGLTVNDISGLAIANLGYDSVVHMNPVFIGDTIYAETKILKMELTKSQTKGLVYVETIGFNQKNVPVIKFQRHFLVPLKK